MTQSDPQRSALRGRSPGQAEEARRFAVEMACLCVDRHCERILVLDLRGRSDITDYLLIASGTSDRQIRAVGAEITDLAESQFGLRRFGSEVDEATTWLVLDFVDVIVHLFEPEARAYYDIEMLWDDAAQVAWERESDEEKGAGEA